MSLSKKKKTQHLQLTVRILPLPVFLVSPSVSPPPLLVLCSSCVCSLCMLGWSCMADPLSVPVDMQPTIYSWTREKTHAPIFLPVPLLTLHGPCLYFKVDQDSALNLLVCSFWFSFVKRTQLFLPSVFQSFCFCSTLTGTHGPSLQINECIITVIVANWIIWIILSIQGKSYSLLFPRYVDALSSMVIMLSGISHSDTRV